MYQVGIEHRFQAKHALRGDFGPESSPHAHEYRVGWTCGAEGLDENGFSVDIALMEEKLHHLLGSLEGQYLNDLDFFRERQSSVENLAHFIHQGLFRSLSDAGYATERIEHSEVKVWESESAWASYSSQK